MDLNKQMDNIEFLQNVQIKPQTYHLWLKLQKGIKSSYVNHFHMIGIRNENVRDFLCEKKEIDHFIFDKRDKSYVKKKCKSHTLKNFFFCTKWLFSLFFFV